MKITKPLSFFCSAVTVSTISVSCTESKTSEAERPNVIYILMDDFGYGESGSYGQLKIETPNIDKLASNGILFSQHYSASAVSAPARCGLLTGLHSGHMQIRGNDEQGSRGNVWSHQAMLDDPSLEGQAPLADSTRTIGGIMQQAGYETACIGKWGLGAPGSTGEPNNLGFDLFYGYNCQRVAHTYYPAYLWKNRERVYLNNEVLQPGTKLDKGADPYDEASYAKFNQEQYSPDLMFDEVISFVEDNEERPFFLMWTTPIPHAALQAPKEMVDYYVEKFGDEEPYLGKGGYFPSRYPKATYAAMNTYFDNQVGLLVSKLKELGIYDNTIIVFTSDNGATYNGGTSSPWFNSGGKFKSEMGWGKGSLHEGGIRVPLIVSWPNTIKSAIKTDHISFFPDIMPTLCELTGVDPNIDTDGISLLPTILGESDKQKKHEYLYWEFPESGGWRAVRWGEWKAIQRDIHKGNKAIELYNLTTDIQELNDISAQHPDIVEQIEVFMAAEHTPPTNKRFEMKF